MIELFSSVVSYLLSGLRIHQAEENTQSKVKRKPHIHLVKLL